MTKVGSDARVGSSQRWRRLIPVVFITYSLAYLDRSNYSFGAAGGLKHDLGIGAGAAGLLGALYARREPASNRTSPSTRVTSSRSKAAMSIPGKDRLDVRAAPPAWSVRRRSSGLSTELVESCGHGAS